MKRSKQSKLLFLDLATVTISRQNAPQDPLRLTIWRLTYLRDRRPVKEMGEFAKSTTSERLALVFAADVSVSEDQLVGGAGLVVNLVAVLEAELGAIVAHRDPNLHAQTR